MPRLLLISIDGLAHFYWNDPLARMPVLRGLAERGASADGMETVFISTTWPSHVSLVTGVGPRAHGVVANHILNRASGRAEELTSAYWRRCTMRSTRNASTAGISSTTETVAPIVKFCWPETWL